MGDGSTDENRETVEWRSLSADEVSSPIVQRLPYLELKLEHPGLDPSGFGNRFFPDAVPYELDGTRRVFYWRPALRSTAGDADDWELAIATTDELAGIGSLPATAPQLTGQNGNETLVVVDGTVAGESTTRRVWSYTVPQVSIGSLADSKIALTVDGTEYSVPVGERRRIQLAEQRVEPVSEDHESRMVTPELVARYPGRRELHHPSPNGAYRLFPSFGLNLEELPNPLPVPSAAGELDDTALAEQLGVDLAQRPYPERVLWQAFAHTAFGQHSETTPELTQSETRHIILHSEGVSG